MSDAPAFRLCKLLAFLRQSTARRTLRSSHIEQTSDAPMHRPWNQFPHGVKAASRPVAIMHLACCLQGIWRFDIASQSARRHLICTVFCAAFLFGGIGSSSPLQAQGFRDFDIGCRHVDGRLVCGLFQDDRRQDRPGGGSKRPGGGNRGESGANSGERSCPPGYVVLDKPNKYGAFCEPREGFPASSSPAPKQAAKCQFPGEIGTPPNCRCPSDTQFYGYRGCMKTCCSTPSKDPKYTKVYMECAKDTATAHRQAVALAKANGDPGNRVSCEVTRNYPQD